MKRRFVRSFSISQCAPPSRTLLAPALPITPARIGVATGVDHDFARVAVASFVDELGRRARCGARLRVAFGRIGTWEVKKRTVGFIFGEGYRRDLVAPPEGTYSDDVRRILAKLDAGEVGSSSSQISCSRRKRPDSSPAVRCGSGSSTSAADLLLATRRRGAKGNGSGDRQLPTPGSTHRWCDTRRRPATCDAVIASDIQSTQCPTEACTSSSGSVYDGGFGIKTSDPRGQTIAGSAAVVAGGPARSEVEDPFDASKASGQQSDRGQYTASDVSPRAAKRVLPHFLAIGNPRSQALVPAEGAEIVQRQAKARFEKVKAANRSLDDKIKAETRLRQASKSKEYEERDKDERRRLKEYLTGIKAQAESQRARRAKEKTAEFLSHSADPCRAYPCRRDYDADKEMAWRRAWCTNLEGQVKEKERLASEAKREEASRERVRAAQLDAAIKADRRYEARCRQEDRARIHRTWEEQMSMLAVPESKSAQAHEAFVLDKIVR